MRPWVDRSAGALELAAEAEFVSADSLSLSHVNDLVAKNGSMLLERIRLLPNPSERMSTWHGSGMAYTTNRCRFLS